MKDTEYLMGFMIATIILILYATGTFSRGSMSQEQRNLHTLFMIPVFVFVIPVILAIEGIAFYLASD